MMGITTFEPYPALSKFENLCLLFIRTECNPAISEIEACGYSKDFVMEMTSHPLWGSGSPKRILESCNHYLKLQGIHVK